VKPNLASALTLGAAAAAAIAIVTLGSNKAYAGNITMAPTPFVGSDSRAEVRVMPLTMRKPATGAAWSAAGQLQRQYNLDL
jgi:hypothetical protein